MKAKKLLTVASACAMVSMVMSPSVFAANGDVETRDTKVSYDFSATVDPVNPSYGVSVPAGIVFDATDPTKSIETNVKMIAGEGEEEIVGPVSAQVKVKSANGSKVQLADGKDEVEYGLTYGSNTLSGTTEMVVGTLNYQGSGDAGNVTEIAGRAKLKGVATKTGLHSDTLTYTITDKTA